MKPKSSFNPWPVSLIAFFTILITAIASFVTFASSHKLDLVSPDYYDQEIKFQKQMDQVQRTSALRGSCTTSYQATNHAVEIVFPAEHRGHITGGTVSFYRPSDASLDQTLDVKPSETGVQSIPTTSLAKGFWRIKVRWKVADADYYHESDCTLP